MLGFIQQFHIRSIKIIYIFSGQCAEVTYFNKNTVYKLSVMKKYLECTVTYFAPLFFLLSFDFSVFNCNCFFYSSENYIQQMTSV